MKHRTFFLVRIADAFRDDPIYRFANSVDLRAVSFYTARTGSRCSRKLWPIWLQGKSTAIDLEATEQLRKEALWASSTD